MCYISTLFISYFKETNDNKTKTLIFTMSWITQVFTSAIGKKLIMSLTGLFLCLFLVVHMSGNFLLFNNDGGQAFNEYTKFMTTFPLIKVASIFTFFGIILHAVDGLLLTLKNRKARPVKYAVQPKRSSWASRNMAVLGIIVLFFLIVHLKSFWYVMKFGEVGKVIYNGHEYKDLYTVVIAAFSQWWYVAIYVVSLIALGYHLVHGFASAFQTLGVNHSKYTPFIKFVGYAYAILVPIGFASQLVIVYLTVHGYL